MNNKITAGFLVVFLVLFTSLISLQITNLFFPGNQSILGLNTGTSVPVYPTPTLAPKPTPTITPAPWSTPTPVQKMLPCYAVYDTHSRYCLGVTPKPAACTGIEQLYEHFCYPNYFTTPTPTSNQKPTITPIPTSIGNTAPYLNIIPVCVGSSLTATIKGGFNNFYYNYKYYWIRVFQPSTQLSIHYSTVAANSGQNNISAYLRPVISDIKTGKSISLIGNGQSYYVYVFGTDSYEHAGNLQYSTTIVSQSFLQNCDTSPKPTPISRATITPLL
jgi:hypothetical protein